MKEELRNLLNQSYAPYSHYAVSAIVVMKDGKYFTGVNIENASFGATVCAERVAIFEAIKEGYRKGDFKRLYVMVDRDKIASCCFLCRQVISEFFEDDCEIILSNRNGDARKYYVREICPLPFTGDDLV